MLTVFIGGLTRLTDSGLSITKWELLTGIVPPNSQESWQKVFQEYQKYPEYQKVKSSMNLLEFKFIYYMEYFHRLLGRMLGVITLIPFGIFLFLRAITRKEFFQYSVLSIFLLLQGFLGWYMVKSGLVDNPDVSHYRLTLHFVTALIYISISYWYFLGYSSLKKFALCAVDNYGYFFLGLLLFFQIVLGCFMSGLDAGHVSNTFPKIFGYYVPPGILGVSPWYVNFVENTVTIHFFHRLIGISMVLLILVMWMWTGKMLYLQFLIFNMIQAFLGIVAVLNNIPIYIASIHQMVAVLIVLVYTHHLYGITHMEKEHKK